MSLTQQGNPIVCDSQNKCIKIFSASGDLSKTLGKGRLKLPLDCVFHDKKIYVSDTEAHLIKVYDGNSGKFMSEFRGCKNSIGKRIIEPAGLAIDKTGHLLITDPKLVNMFTLEGTFVTSFGTTSLQKPLWRVCA